jgi:HPt (histidine-containing phosphotransfer) domain-containing protein
VTGKAAEVASGRDLAEDYAASQSTAPIDHAYLARFTLGNAALEREVLELFAGQAAVYVAQLREAVTRKAWKDAAHGIKGSARAVGARRLASLAQFAEQLDVEADLPDVDACREQAVAAVAEGAEEACRYIACLFATA